MSYMIPVSRELKDKIKCVHCNRTNQIFPNYVAFESFVAVKSYSNITKPERLCPADSTTKESLTTKQTTTTRKLTSTNKTSTTTTTEKPTTTMKTTTRKLTCPEGWFRSERPKGPWCIRVTHVFKKKLSENLQMAFNSYDVLDRSTAIGTCTEEGAMISGLESVLEADFVRKRTRDKMISTIDLSSADFQGWGVWINGERLNGEEAFTYTDPYLTTREGYIWYEGQPDGFYRIPQQNCIQLMVPKDFNDDRFGKLNDLDCKGVEAYAMSLKGVVCGKPAT
ncbi:hypothetical protein CAEBREN_19353 [Caenorhabditis brenneri]|uniref:C-type lectin domain-containing protein n=1 Tax=Caenorhabditis brenneri TaxID=135651 RepID=G0MT86_CAEBE|nr:hypothetical protein CAEBREN_19353 [Caenorhabditis brenneri]